MCRLKGLRSIEYGNHDAIHDGRSSDDAGILIYHYPVRTYQEFLSKVINHGTSLLNNPEIPPRIGWHVRRWYSLHEKGLLEEEYERLLIADDCVETYIQSGVLERDDSIAEIFHSGLSPAQ